MRFAVTGLCWAAGMTVLLALGCDAAVRPDGGRSRTAEEFVNVLGGAYSLPGPLDCTAIVLLFLGHDCPISNGYSPEIQRLQKEFSPQRVAFCIVYADSDLKADEARQHAKEFGYTCPAILDPRMSLAAKVGATVKPEAAVLSAGGDLLYLGRIDDSYIDFGLKRPQPTHRDLKEALEAILAGNPAPTARTPAVGCPIEMPDPKN